jgi:hypothetical protein
MRNTYRISVAKPEGDRPLGIPRHRWVNNVEVDLGEIEGSGTDNIDLAQDRDWWRDVVNTVMNLWDP